MKFPFVAFLLLFGIISCDLPLHYRQPPPPCVSKMGGMNLENQLEEKTQNDLREKIRGRRASEFLYSFETFIKEEGETYMVTNFRNDTECLQIKLHIGKLGKLKGMYRTNGASYPKELYDLT